MIRLRGGKQVEEGSALAKVTWKQTPSEVKKIHKML
jgi:hypothetical protein